jgi:hypothetical protein
MQVALIRFPVTLASKAFRAIPSLVNPDWSQGDVIIVYVLRGPAARFPRLGLSHSEPSLQE